MKMPSEPKFTRGTLGLKLSSAKVELDFGLKMERTSDVENRGINQVYVLAYCFLD